MPVCVCGGQLVALVTMRVRETSGLSKLDECVCVCVCVCVCLCVCVFTKAAFLQLPELLANYAQTAMKHARSSPLTARWTRRAVKPSNSSFR